MKNTKSKSLIIFFVSLIFVVLFSLNALAATEDEAKATALKDAGLREDEVTFYRIHLDREHKRSVYDIEFYSGNIEYDYEIDASTGEILEFNKEIEKRKTKQTICVNNENYIGKEAAKAAALKEAGLTETDVRKIEVELDREKGKAVYEVEFKSGRKEYEFDIDAIDGTVVKSDIEYDD